MSPSGGNSAPAVALYVFSGPHLGARLELAEGSWVLGSDDSCDIILSGLAPRHALLEAAAGERGSFDLTNGTEFCIKRRAFRGK